MTIQSLDISPVGRVEGDLDVRVDIEDGYVVNAWTHAELFRGFEVILRGKDPQAGLIVTPRICGICGGSHLTCYTSHLWYLRWFSPDLCILGIRYALGDRGSTQCNFGKKFRANC